MRKTFTQGIAALSTVIAVALTTGATAGASTLTSLPPAGAASQAAVSQNVTSAGLALVPVTDPALLSRRPANVPPPASLYVLRSGAGSNLCLDADTKTLGRNGTKVQLWTCTYQAPGWPASNQLWWLSATLETLIQSNQSGRCLDADLGALGHPANGVKVQLWDCTPDFENVLTYNQVWHWQTPNELLNRGFNACLNADGSASRAIVHLWSCSPNGARDQWYPGT